MAQIKADEITQILREQIANYDSKVQVDEVGTITSLGDGIARLHGLDKVMAGELLSFPHGIAGLALSLEEDSVGAVILGDYTELSEGDEVKRTGTILSVPVGEGMIGRVVNALGQPIDDKGPIASKASLPIERLAPGIIDRQPVREPMATGLKAIDSMIPIGRGQRELIIGDRQTGKTAVLLDTIINNAKNDLICIYCAIGQKRSSIAQVVQTLTEAGAMGHTVIVAASASEPAPMLYIAPYAATRHRRVLPRLEAPRAGDVRRSLQARHGLPRDFAAAAPSTGPRSLSGRCLLSPFAFAGARLQVERQKGRRLADRAAGD